MTTTADKLLALNKALLEIDAHGASTELLDHAWTILHNLYDDAHEAGVRDGMERSDVAHRHLAAADRRMNAKS